MTTRNDDVEQAEVALGGRLADARSRKGVDIHRAERDTRIRARYLLALEYGDAAALPGGAYTTGFVRTYAAYLGLDADAAAAAWEREHRDVRAVRRIWTRQPLRMPRRTITLSPGMLRPLLFVAVVTAFAVYLGSQFLRVAQPPTLTILEPATAVTTLDATATSYVLRGVTSPRAIVSIASPGREQPYRLAAGGDGSWSLRVELRRGANLFDVEVRDPQTGKTANPKSQLFITVPFVVVDEPTLRVDQPFRGATFDRGSVPVQGVARNAERVAVTASPVAARTVGANTVTRDVTVRVADDGFFTTSLVLTVGTWKVEVVAIAADGRLVTIEREVVVVPAAAAR
jgi:hypothetical protein